MTSMSCNWLKREQPLLDMVMQYTRGNQTRAALMMGINRGTLRKN